MSAGVPPRHPSAGALLFLMGLIDDIANLKPIQKLVIQVIAASIVIQAGLPWHGHRRWCSTR
jgi:UDP-N-acetylmuramyl pentapeptide phosphotransferase/UDP-N-acetylglucosamine-1-phosphate transferase